MNNYKTLFVEIVNSTSSIKKPNGMLSCMIFLYIFIKPESLKLCFTTTDLCNMLIFKNIYKYIAWGNINIVHILIIQQYSVAANRAMPLSYI